MINGAFPDNELAFGSKIAARAYAGAPAQRSQAAFGLCAGGHGHRKLLIVVSTRLERVATRNLSGEAMINDGDSITLKGERIRLRGIDAPEYQPDLSEGWRILFLRQLSREALARLAKAGLIYRGWERDRYDRLLAVCAAGGVELNRRQVEQGWAVAYGDYGDAEAAAWLGRSMGRLIQRPRDWRVRHGGMAEGEHDLLAKFVNWLKAIIFSFS